MIDLTTLTNLRIKSLINTPERCEIFSKYTPLLIRKGISPEEILGILTENKEGNSALEEALKNL